MLCINMSAKEHPSHPTKNGVADNADDDDEKVGTRKWASAQALAFLLVNN